MHKSRRVFFFILSIALGLAAGIAFGWLVLPAQPARNASLNRLRADYKTDLVLMTAESFADYQNAFVALDNLAVIDTDGPVSLIDHAITYAQSLSYAAHDLITLQNLRDGLDTKTITTWSESRAGGHGN